MNWSCVFMVITAISSSSATSPPYGWIDLGAVSHNHKYPSPHGHPVNRQHRHDASNDQGRGFQVIYPDWTKYFTTGVGNMGITRQPPNHLTSRPNFYICIMSCNNHKVTADYNPVCGTNFRTYENADLLYCEKGCGVDVSILLTTRCPSIGVNPVTTARYIDVTSTTTATDTDPRVKHATTVQSCINSCQKAYGWQPVCGTDNITYMNSEHIMCAQFCGVNVNVRKFSACTNNTVRVTATTPQTITKPSTYNNWVPTSTLPYHIQFCLDVCPTAPENNPVCGTNGITYRNPKELQCHKICGIDVQLKQLSSCSNVNFGTGSFTPTSSTKRTFTEQIQPTSSTQRTTTETDRSRQIQPTSSTQRTTTEPDRSKEIQPISSTQRTTTEPDRSKEIQPTSSTQSTIKTTAKSKQELCIDKCMIGANDEYKPVCGTDYLTYKNYDRLMCASSCNVDVDVATYFACEDSSTNTNMKTKNLGPVITKIFSTTEENEFIIDPRHLLKRR